MIFIMATLSSQQKGGKRRGSLSSFSGYASWLFTSHWPNPVCGHTRLHGRLRNVVVSWATSLVVTDMCLVFSFQGRTSRSRGLPDSRISRALQGKGASLLPRGSSCASTQRKLSSPPRPESHRSPVSPVLSTATSPPAQRTFPTRCPAFPSSAPQSTSLPRNGQTRAPREQPRSVSLSNPGSQAEEPHDRSRVADHHQAQPSPGRKTSNSTFVLPTP